MEASLLGEKKIITLSSVEYAALSDAAKAMDVIYNITDDTLDVNIDTASLSNDATHVPASPLVKSAIDNVACRENLLDNWCFLNPVNQRGQNSYTGYTYTIDRWSQSSVSNRQYASVSLTSSGLRLVGTGVSGDIGNLIQVIPSGFAGKKATLSFFVSEVTAGTINFGTVTISTATVSIVNGVTFIGAVSSPGVYSVQLTIPSAPSSRIGVCLVGSQDCDVTVSAVKLELGDTQTLAHKVESTWVLNELPNYEEQFIHCKSRTADSSDTYANDSVAFQSTLGFKPRSVRLARQKKAVITLSTYDCAIRFFGVTTQGYYCDMIYSYGYIIQLDNNADMSISVSSDWLTITISNNASSNRTMDLGIVVCEREATPLTWSVVVQDIT